MIARLFRRFQPSADEVAAPPAPAEALRARRQALRSTLAGCLFLVNKLEADARRHGCASRVAQQLASRAREAGDCAASRRSLLRARDLLDAAEDAEAKRLDLRRRTDAGLEMLRRVNVELARLDRERLALVADERRTLLENTLNDESLSDYLLYREAERELDAELSSL